MEHYGICAEKIRNSQSSFIRNKFQDLWTSKKSKKGKLENGNIVDRLFCKGKKNEINSKFNVVCKSNDNFSNDEENGSDEQINVFNNDSSKGSSCIRCEVEEKNNKKSFKHFFIRRLSSLQYPSFLSRSSNRKKADSANKDLYVNENERASESDIGLDENNLFLTKELSPKESRISSISTTLSVSSGCFLEECVLYNSLDVVEGKKDSIPNIVKEANENILLDLVYDKKSNGSKSKLINEDVMKFNFINSAINDNQNTTDISLTDVVDVDNPHSNYFNSEIGYQINNEKNLEETRIFKIENQTKNNLNLSNFFRTCNKQAAQIEQKEEKEQFTETIDRDLGILECNNQNKFPFALKSMNFNHPLQYLIFAGSEENDANNFNVKSEDMSYLDTLSSYYLFDHNSVSLSQKFFKNFLNQNNSVNFSFFPSLPYTSLFVKLDPVVSDVPSCFPSKVFFPLQKIHADYDSSMPVFSLLFKDKDEMETKINKNGLISVSFNNDGKTNTRMWNEINDEKKNERKSEYEKCVLKSVNDPFFFYKDVMNTLELQDEKFCKKNLVVQNINKKNFKIESAICDHKDSECTCFFESSNLPFTAVISCEESMRAHVRPKNFNSNFFFKTCESLFSEPLPSKTARHFTYPSIKQNKNCGFYNNMSSDCITYNDERYMKVENNNEFNCDNHHLSKNQKKKKPKMNDMPLYNTLTTMEEKDMYLSYLKLAASSSSSRFSSSGNARVRRDSMGRVIRRGSKRHSICFVDEATNNKTGLKEIFEVESYKHVYYKNCRRKNYFRECVIM